MSRGDTSPSRGFLARNQATVFSGSPENCLATRLIVEAISSIRTRTASGMLLSQRTEDSATAAIRPTSAFLRDKNWAAFLASKVAPWPNCKRSSGTVSNRPNPDWPESWRAAFASMIALLMRLRRWDVDYGRHITEPRFNHLYTLSQMGVSLVCQQRKVVEWQGLPVVAVMQPVRRNLNCTSPGPLPPPPPTPPPRTPRHLASPPISTQRQFRPLHHRIFHSGSTVGQFVGLRLQQFRWAHA
ncbi:hypothetical protein C8C96_2504 [Acidovorax sp. 100]|nr:hypothetical protein C8C96_2504 [Acidovorax sp. 100]